MTDNYDGPALVDQINRLKHQLAATQKAKAENDERFMIERDEARAKLDDRIEWIKVRDRQMKGMDEMIGRLESKLAQAEANLSATKDELENINWKYKIVIEDLNELRANRSDTISTSEYVDAMNKRECPKHHIYPEECSAACRSDTTAPKSVTITRADYAKACKEADKDQHRIGIFGTFFERVCFHLGLEETEKVADTYVLGTATCWEADHQAETLKRHGLADEFKSTVTFQAVARAAYEAGRRDENEACAKTIETECINHTADMAAMRIRSCYPNTQMPTEGTK